MFGLKVSVFQEKRFKAAMPMALLSAFSIVESLQLLVILAWIAGFIHFPLTLAKAVFPERMNLVGHGDWAWWVVVFALITAGIQAAAVYFFKKHRNPEGLIRSLVPFLIVEACLLLLILDTLFKITVYDDRTQLARIFYYILMAALVLNKVFWFEIEVYAKKIYAYTVGLSRSVNLMRVLSGLFVLFIFLLIYTPNPEGVVARIFMGEQFHHWDSFVMGPGWAYASGSILNVEVVSRYGLGMPIIVSQLTKIFGGFSHLNVFLVLMWVGLTYYILWYLLLRRWFNSALVAAIVILVCIRTQMFHTGTYPFVFTYPSATPMRFCFDIFFMAAIYFHLRTHRNIFLWIAGAMAGVGMFHLTAEGLYLTAALYFYIAAHILMPAYRSYIYTSKKDIRNVIGYFLTAPIVAAVLFYSAQGRWLWTKEFWNNMSDFIMFFVSGFGTNPIYQSLQSHLYLQSLMGFVIPLVYVFSLILIAGLWYLRKIEYEGLFGAVLCVYGLGLFHYYISLSMWTSYYMIGLPFWFVMGYWFKKFVDGFSPRVGTNIKMAAFACAFLALATNHSYIAYPNALNLSRNPIVDPLVAQQLPNRMPYFNHLFYQYPDAYKMPLNSLGEVDEGLRMEPSFHTDVELVDYYHREFNFEDDVKLIQGLTLPHSRVALISSFEIKMLMQADRQPFFYVFPLVNSRPMRMRNFVVTHLYTVDHLKKTLLQLEEQKPEYIFMERIFLNRSVPQAYLYDSPGLMEVLNYANDLYEPSAYGKYLVAMKRK